MTKGELPGGVVCATPDVAGLIVVTGTLGGVTPVTKVDGGLIADGKAGKVAKEASDLYLRSVGAI